MALVFGPYFDAAYAPEVLAERRAQVPLERAAQLQREGEKLFRHIVRDLNAVADAHIRTEMALYRREEDYREVCVALGLAVEKLLECNLLPADLWAEWSRP
jgi:hypothetical protein